MASGGNTDGDEPDFQIAPMIDVLLVLLIFFMSITTVQVARVDKAVTLPTAENATKRQDARDESIVNIRWDPAAQKATFTFEDAPYDKLDTLVPILAQRQAGSPRYRVVIRGDRLVPAEYISLVMAAAAEANIADVTFSVLAR